jgi:hypothetical protein
MPTKHPRHAITETGAVAEALEQLRAEVGPENFTLSELVVLGAQRKIFEHTIRAEAKRKRRALVAEKILTRTLPKLDLAAAEEVRRRGWAREA